MLTFINGNIAGTARYELCMCLSAFLRLCVRLRLWLCVYAIWSLDVYLVNINVIHYEFVCIL